MECAKTGEKTKSHKVPHSFHLLAFTLNRRFMFVNSKNLGHLLFLFFFFLRFLTLQVVATLCRLIQSGAHSPQSIILFARSPRSSAVRFSKLKRATVTFQIFANWWWPTFERLNNDGKLKWRRVYLRRAWAIRRLHAKVDGREIFLFFSQQKYKKREEAKREIFVCFVFFFALHSYEFRNQK